MDDSYLYTTLTTEWKPLEDLLKQILDKNQQILQDEPPILHLESLVNNTIRTILSVETCSTTTCFQAHSPGGPGALPVSSSPGSTHSSPCRGRRGKALQRFLFWEVLLH